jgi:1-acyl-sn-glycerol-3-phosphate acyltransferase
MGLNFSHPQYPEGAQSKSSQDNGELEGYNYEEAFAFAQKVYPALKRYFRFELKGKENLPAEPFLMVGNHSGGVLCIDSYLLAAQYILWGKKPFLRFLVHDALILLTQMRIGKILKSGGAIRADYNNALKALQSGFSVLVYPGGEQENNRPFWRRHEVDFLGHTGYIHLALQARTPIVPVVSIGAHETLIILGQWKGPDITEKIASILGLDAQGLSKYKPRTNPISLALPWGISFGHLPFLPLPAQITTEILPPIDISSYPPEAAEDSNVIGYLDRMVRGYLQIALDRLAKDRIPFVGARSSIFQAKKQKMR